MNGRFDPFFRNDREKCFRDRRLRVLIIRVICRRFRVVGLVRVNALAVDERGPVLYFIGPSAVV